MAAQVARHAFSVTPNWLVEKQLEFAGQVALAQLAEQ
jgi:hypothetical protein